MNFSDDERGITASRFAYNGLTETIALMIWYVTS